MPGMVSRTNFAIAISAPVLPAETATLRLAVLHRLDRLPHAALAAAAAQRLARLVRHGDRNLGMVDRGLGGNVGILREEAAQPRCIADRA